MHIQFLLRQFSDYCTYEKNYTQETVKRYNNLITYSTKFLNISQVEEITIEKLRQLFYYGRSKRNWSSNTFITYHKTLNGFCKWCVNRGYMDDNPVESIEVPKLEKSLPKALSKQETEKILEIADNYPFENKFLRYRNYAIFSILIFAGIRKTELLKLKYTDVDIENMSIFIRLGKGNKDRIIPINSRLAEALQRYKEERIRQYKTCPEFFTSYTYNVGFTDSGLKRIIMKIKNASGVKFSSHPLRHTFATLMLEAGCDLFSLSKILGHNDLKTTAIYLGASAQHLRNQILKHPLG